MVVVVVVVVVIQVKSFLTHESRATGPFFVSSPCQVRSINPEDFAYDGDDDDDESPDDGDDGQLLRLVCFVASFFHLALFSGGVGLKSADEGDETQTAEVAADAGQDRDGQVRVGRRASSDDDAGLHGHHVRHLLLSAFASTLKKIESSKTRDFRRRGN